jgi:UDP-N-acetyl-alpha-D-muramoyl-L-alanyl-L-glutamate epimerase
VTYFSLLRPLSELHIMQIFSTYPHYFDRFTSCNKNWKLAKVANEPDPTQNSKFKIQNSSKLWCGHCPKCAFSFALLSAFLPRAHVIRIFGKDLFADEDLLPLYRELLGLEGIKPFECVGTPEETAAAMLLADERGEWDASPVMAMFRAEASEKFSSADSIVNDLLMPSGDHAIPEPFRSVLPA